MTLDFLQWLVSSLIVGFFVVAGMLIRYGYQQGEQAEQLKSLRRDIALIQTAIYSRADVELVQKGWADFHSSIHLGQIAVDAVLPFLDLFVPFYVELLEKNPKITEQEIFWAITERFNAELIEKVCYPHGLSQLGCVRTVLELCKLEVSKRDATGPAT